MVEISRKRRKAGARHVTGAVCALAVAGGALMLSAESVSAYSLPQVCSGAFDANVCLSGYTNDPIVQVHVGVDVWMSAQDAQALQAQPGNALSAALYGDDGSTKQFLQALTITYEAAGSSSLSAEFDMAVQRSALNEDPGGWPRCNKDEVFARVSLYDARHGVRTFDSPSWSICF